MASADGNASPPTTSMDTTPAVCANGCGFFGNPNTGGMCSKCYKETLQNKTAAPVAAPAASPAPLPAAASPVVEPPAPQPPAPTPPALLPPAPLPASTPAPPAPLVDASVAAPAADADGVEEPPKKKQMNTSRCFTCNKKIGLLGFKCKCEFFFCAEHRYSDRHACEVDYKALGKEQLAKANPTVSPAKMQTF